VAGDELATVVGAQQLWPARRWLKGLCQGALHAARGDRPLDRAGDQLTGVLVDDVEIRNERPSVVWPLMKSYAQMWSGYSARRFHIAFSTPPSAWLPDLAFPVV
jgi:hypothetical protein